MKTTASTLKIAAGLAVLLVIAACNPIAQDSESNSMLIVESITGTTIAGDTALILESDVSTTTSDTATVTLQASLLDPTGGITGPSQYNDVTLTGYRIDYTLPDGTGEPGVTVPSSIEGTASSLLIKIGESKTVDFLAVLAAAKVNPPLNAYLGSTTPHQIVAHCTFTGLDGTNHVVEAKGRLTIIFADY